MREDEQAFFEEPEFQESLRKYEEARQSGLSLYMDADELTDIAEYYMVQEREEQADEAIRLAVDLHPESVDPQVFLARQQMFQGHIDRAHEICDAITCQDDQEVFFLKAELMIREQKEKEAYRFLMDCYDRLSSGRATFLYDSAGVFMDYAFWDIALQCTKQLLDEHPNYRKGLSLKADILVSKGDYKEAISLLNHILDEDPYQISAWNLLAESQGAIEQYQEAIESTEYVLAIDQKNQRATITKANCLFHLGQLEEAHELYLSFLKVNPQDSVIYYLDGVCLADLDRYEESARQLDKANEVGKELSPEQLNIYLQQSFVESRLHHLDRAIAALNKARQMEPNDADANEYEFLMGRIFLENRHFNEAEIHFQEAMRISRNHKNTMFKIAIAFADSDFFTTAAGILENILKTYDDVDVQDAVPYLAYCYFRMDNSEKYLEYIKHAAQCNREITEDLFSAYFPGVEPEEYYLYAFQSINGRFPEE